MGSSINDNHGIGEDTVGRETKLMWCVLIDCEMNAHGTCTEKLRERESATGEVEKLVARLAVRFCTRGLELERHVCMS